VAKLSTEPTEKEGKELNKLSKRGYFHFFLLVILIFVASLTFFMPEDTAALAVVAVGVLICLTAASTVKLQYFQRCPRCDVRMSRVQSACASCGLQYYVSKRSTLGGGWDD
jgi:hypothetical protein